MQQDEGQDVELNAAVCIALGAVGGAVGFAAGLVFCYLLTVLQ